MESISLGWSLVDQVSLRSDVRPHVLSSAPLPLRSHPDHRPPAGTPAGTGDRRSAQVMGIYADDANAILDVSGRPIEGV